MIVAPAYKIDLTHSIWNEVKGKNKTQPSGVELHPTNGDIYIIEWAWPKFIGNGRQWNKKETVPTTQFRVCATGRHSFTQAGELFISNEGRRQ